MQAVAKIFQPLIQLKAVLADPSLPLRRYVLQLLLPCLDTFHRMQGPQHVCHGQHTLMAPFKRMGHTQGTNLSAIHPIVANGIPKRVLDAVGPNAGPTGRDVSRPDREQICHTRILCPRSNILCRALTAPRKSFRQRHSGGSPDIGNKITDGKVNFVTNGRDHGNRAGGNGPFHLLR